MSYRKPFTMFGKTKNIACKVYKNGRLLPGEREYDLSLWIERPDDWYAFSSYPYKDRRVRVVRREEWLQGKEIKKG
jgi:hypothetical protein